VTATAWYKRTCSSTRAARRARWPGGGPRYRLSVQRGQVVRCSGRTDRADDHLQTVAGLLPAISGEITVVGQSPSVRRRTWPRARAGLCPGLALPVPEPAVRQNLTLAARRSRSDVDSVFEYLPALKPLSKRDAGLLLAASSRCCHRPGPLTKPSLLMIDELSMGWRR